MNRFLCWRACYGLAVTLVVCSLGGHRTSAQVLRVGDALPEALWHEPLSLLEGTTTLEAYRGKYLLLDFWASWCSPCVAGMPKLDSLQRTFGDRLQIIPLTYQSPAEVRKLLTRAPKWKGIALPFVVHDTTFTRVFPHSTLPHYVWVDALGHVAAITGMEAIHADTLRRVLSEQPVFLPTKNDRSLFYQPDIPLSRGTYGIPPDHVRASTLFTRYVEGLPTRQDVFYDDYKRITRITLTNAPLLMLYTLAWSNQARYYTRKNTVLDVRDPDVFHHTGTERERLRAWMIDHTFCLEVVVRSGEQADALEQLQNILQQHYPHYRATIEKRHQRCLVLSPTTKRASLPRTQGGTWVSSLTYDGLRLVNCPVSRLVSYLNQTLQHIPLSVVDGTDFTDYIDLHLVGDLHSVEGIQTALAPYGLTLREKTLEQDVLVIRDAPQP
jgi:thiol-disulfide isomerase/thioredoxin